MTPYYGNGSGSSIPLGSIRSATGLSSPLGAPGPRGSDDGRPGYAWRDLLGSAPVREDWAMVAEARPLTPKWTGGEYYDHAGTLEGTKPDPYIHKAASIQNLQDWDFRRMVNG